MSQEPLFEDAHALVVGVPPGRQDAEDVAAVLRDPERCAYPAGAVRTLLDAEATREAIYAGLDALARETTEASTALFYFSGHGARIRAKSAYYLVPADGGRSSAEEVERTGISNAELSARLRKIPAGRLTVVLDCCRASEMADVELADDAIAPLAQGRGRAVLAASRENAWKVHERNSAFTHHLLAGLHGGANAVGGVIRIGDLFDYVQQRFADEPLPQQPLFKAEWEENYPIARHPSAKVVIPPPPDGYPYDAFLSYCPDDLRDRDWISDVVVPRLEGRYGLRVFVDYRDFDLGVPLIEEAERAVRESRYTVAVYTPAYMAGRFQQYQQVMAAHQAMESGEPRLIPLHRQTCELSLNERMTAILDVRHDKEVEPALARLAVLLRQPPRPRRGGQAAVGATAAGGTAAGGTAAAATATTAAAATTAPPGPTIPHATPVADPHGAADDPFDSLDDG